MSDYNADCFPWRSGNGRYLLFASIDLNGVTWDERDEAGEFVPSGVYFYTLKTGKTVQTRKMIMAK